MMQSIRGKQHFILHKYSDPSAALHRVSESRASYLWQDEALFSHKAASRRALGAGLGSRPRCSPGKKTPRAVRVGHRGQGSQHGTRRPCLGRFSAAQLWAKAVCAALVSRHRARKTFCPLRAGSSKTMAGACSPSQRGDIGDPTGLWR